MRAIESCVRKRNRRHFIQKINHITVRYVVSRCFEPSQPLGIISGLKQTLIKRYIIEKKNEAEIRPEEQSEKTESCRENLWNEIQLKGP